MDEAEHLGDRVSILNNGTIDYCGSMEYLKQIFSSALSVQVSFLNSNATQEFNGYLNSMGIVHTAV